MLPSIDCRHKGSFCALLAWRSMTRRRLPPLALGIAALVVTVTLAGGAFAVGALVHTARREATAGPGSPEDRLSALAGRLRPDGPYRDPTADERHAGVAAVRDLIAGRRADATAGLARLGFTASDGVDPASGRRFLMLAGDAHGDRAWGVLLVDLSAPPRLALEVPHPNSDLETQRVAAEAFSRLPGSILLMAGAHRRADHDSADVAHNDHSMFDAMAEAFADESIPQVQIHGYATANLPDSDVVVSTGTAPGNQVARSLAGALDRAGFQTCRAWLRRCGRLEGTTNVQGHYADRHDAVFIHLEISWRVRGDHDRRRALAEAIATAGVAG